MSQFMYRFVCSIIWLVNVMQCDDSENIQKLDCETALRTCALLDCQENIQNVVAVQFVYFMCIFVILYMLILGFVFVDTVYIPAN